MEAMVRERVECGVLLALKMREVMIKECKWPLEARKSKEIDFSLESVEGVPSWQHWNFSPVKPISQFWPPAPIDKKFELSWTTKYLIIYCSTNKKPTHRTNFNAYWAPIRNQYINKFQMPADHHLTVILYFLICLLYYFLKWVFQGHFLLKSFFSQFLPCNS